MRQPSEKIFTSSHNSPIGRLYVASSPKGICRIALKSSKSHFKAELLRRFKGASITDSAAPFKKLFKLLDKYFSGKEADFRGLKLDLRGSPFDLLVWRRLRLVSPGKTKSYGDIAKLVSVPKGARAVGGACGRNPVLIVVPCHRIIASSGKIGGFYYGSEVKKHLLRLEGGG